jgi:hypothetical protein
LKLFEIFIKIKARKKSCTVPAPVNPLIPIYVNSISGRLKSVKWFVITRYNDH